MPKLTYKVDNAGALEIYLEDAELPFLFQPTWPNGSAWKKGEAEAWAEQFILAANDPTADFAGDEPSQPTKPRQQAEEPEQIAQ